MRAELRGLFSLTLPGGASETPDDPYNCWQVMQADIGIQGEEGADTFTFYVTTPAFLERTLYEGAYQFGRGLVIVRRFDWTVIEEFTKTVCADVRGESWEEIAHSLSRNFLWEFEDYRG